MYLFFRSSWSVRKAIHCQPRWPSIKNWATVSRKQPTIINFIELFTFMKWLLVTVLSKTKLYKHFVAAILQKKIWAGGFEPEGRYWGLLELGSGYESPCWYFFFNTRHCDLRHILLNEIFCPFFAKAHLRGGRRYWVEVPILYIKSLAHDSGTFLLICSGSHSKRHSYDGFLWLLSGLSKFPLAGC